MTTDVDLALLGAGGAGLAVVVALDRAVAGRRAAGLDVRVPSVALVDPVVRTGTDRTWCFWDAPDGDVLGAVAPAVHRIWRHVEVVSPDGERRVHDLDPLRYVMVRSADYYALAEKAIAALGAVRVVAPAQDADLRARWTLDSRPAAPLRPANTAWLQHFRGRTVRFPAGTPLDPDLPVLMDFSTPQPPRAVSFGYVLPLPAGPPDAGPPETGHTAAADPAASTVTTEPRALVEYTEFSRARLDDAGYDAALNAYLARRFGPDAAAAAVVEEVEDGAIPMSDAVLEVRTGPTSWRIGTAGGATRPSTGYTFAAMQRQATAVAEALLDGRPPAPPPAYPARHRWMDAVLLRALDRGHTGGARLLADLFARNRPADVLRFLDGRTTPARDLALMATTPMAAMTAATFGDAAARAARRTARPTASDRRS